MKNLLQQNEIDYVINLARNGLSNHIQGLCDQMVTVAEIIAGFSEKSALVKNLECVVTLIDENGNLIHQSDTVGSKYPLYKNIINATIAAGKNITMSQVSTITLTIDIITEKKVIRTIGEIDEAIDGLIITARTNNETRYFLPGNKFKNRASLLITHYSKLEKLAIQQIKG